MQYISLRIILKRIKAIPYFLKDKTVPKRKKAFVIFGLVYLILPVDLIPPILFPFGFLDDLILWIYILWTFKEELDAYWVGEKTEDFSQKFSGKNMVEGVKYEVSEDEEKSSESDADKE